MSRQQLKQTLWGENRGKVLTLLAMILFVASIQLWQGLWIKPRLDDSLARLRQAKTALQLEDQRVTEGGGAVMTTLSEDLEQFYQIVPDRNGLGSFIGRLYSYAESSGIDIDQITYAAKPVKETDLLGYQLSFSVSGRYVQVKKFIHLLETSPSLLILHKIALAETRQEKEELVRLQIQLQTFFRGGEQ